MNRSKGCSVIGLRRAHFEASTESEWVSRYLERLGHEVIVAETNFAPMYATGSSRVKTDKRDGRITAQTSKRRSL